MEPCFILHPHAIVESGDLSGLCRCCTVKDCLTTMRNDCWDLLVHAFEGAADPVDLTWFLIELFQQCKEYDKYLDQQSTEWIVNKFLLTITKERIAMVDPFELFDHFPQFITTRSQFLIIYCYTICSVLEHAREFGRLGEVVEAFISNPASWATVESIKSVADGIALDPIGLQLSNQILHIVLLLHQGQMKTSQYRLFCTELNLLVVHRIAQSTISAKDDTIDVHLSNDFEMFLCVVSKISEYLALCEDPSVDESAEHLDETFLVDLAQVMHTVLLCALRQSDTDAISAIEVAIPIWRWLAKTVVSTNYSSPDCRFLIDAHYMSLASVFAAVDRHHQMNSELLCSIVSLRCGALLLLGDNDRNRLYCFHYQRLSPSLFYRLCSYLTEATKICCGESFLMANMNLERIGRFVEAVVQFTSRFDLTVLQQCKLSCDSILMWCVHAEMSYSDQFGRALSMIHLWSSIVASASIRATESLSEETIVSEAVSDAFENSQIALVETVLAAIAWISRNITMDDIVSNDAMTIGSICNHLTSILSKHQLLEKDCCGSRTHRSVVCFLGIALESNRRVARNYDDFRPPCGHFFVAAREALRLFVAQFNYPITVESILSMKAEKKMTLSFIQDLIIAQMIEWRLPTFNANLECCDDLTRFISTLFSIDPTTVLVVLKRFKLIVDDVDFLSTLSSQNSVSTLREVFLGWNFDEWTTDMAIVATFLSTTVSRTFSPVALELVPSMRSLNLLEFHFEMAEWPADEVHWVSSATVMTKYLTENTVFFPRTLLSIVLLLFACQKGDLSNDVSFQLSRVCCLQPNDYMFWQQNLASLHSILEGTSREAVAISCAHICIQLSSRGNSSIVFLRIFCEVVDCVDSETALEVVLSILQRIFPVEKSGDLFSFEVQLCLDLFCHICGNISESESYVECDKLTLCAKVLMNLVTEGCWAISGLNDIYGISITWVLALLIKLPKTQDSMQILEILPDFLRFYSLNDPLNDWTELLLVQTLNFSNFDIVDVARLSSKLLTSTLSHKTISLLVSGLSSVVVESTTIQLMYILAARFTILLRLLTRQKFTFSPMEKSAMLLRCYDALLLLPLHRERSDSKVDLTRSALKALAAATEKLKVFLEDENTASTTNSNIFAPVHESTWEKMLSELMPLTAWKFETGDPARTKAEFSTSIPVLSERLMMTLASIVLEDTN